MSQISVGEAEDLLGKLLAERIPTRMLFLSPSGARLLMSGFIDSKTIKNGVGFSATSPTVDVMQGYFTFRPFDRNCEFEYGEVREIQDKSVREVAAKDGESALRMRFSDPGETVVLFFTL